MTKVKDVRNMSIAELLAESEELNTRIAKASMPTKYFRERKKLSYREKALHMENMIKLYK